ncbi:MAG TPA: hypothetical protein DD618_03410 [Acholeplasmatales bacterium]|nr:hypothetical protein [Acholeplasmatales bacterium]
MTNEISGFLKNDPKLTTLYEQLESKILERMENVKVILQKSQIAFRSSKSFAFVWLPIRPMKNRLESYLILSFGLDYLLSNPRVIEAVGVRPKRWTHHIIIQKPAEIDEEILNWLDQAFRFSLRGFPSFGVLFSKRRFCAFFC